MGSPAFSPSIPISSVARKTAGDLVLYLYEDAAGSGDGYSKTNAFTDPQTAIDAITDIAGNVTLMACKGSTNYLGKKFTVQKAFVKSLTIQGEYSWNASCDTSSTAGRIVDADLDTTGMSIGDRVLCYKYGGTVGNSEVNDYFYAIITSFGTGYVQTSEASKIPTTGWKYVITPTVLDGNNLASGSNGIFGFLSALPSVNLTGICIDNVLSGTSIRSKCQNLTISRSIIRNSPRIYNEPLSYLSMNNSGIINYKSTSGGLELYGIGIVQDSVIAGTSSGSSALFASTTGVAHAYRCFITAASRAVDTSYSPSAFAYLNACNIASSCTQGVYGYNIQLANCTNNASTPQTDLNPQCRWRGQATSDPSSPIGGDHYYNTSSAKMRMYTGSAWIDLN